MHKTPRSTRIERISMSVVAVAVQLDCGRAKRLVSLQKDRSLDATEYQEIPLHRTFELSQKGKKPSTLVPIMDVQR
jgi:hypothetical protein